MRKRGGTTTTALAVELRAGLGPGKGVFKVIRSELVAAIGADHPDLAPAEIDRIVDCVFQTICSRLADGGRVELRGFGTFTTRPRDARAGRNPRTGETVAVEAKRVPYFKPGKEMRARLNVAD